MLENRSFDHMLGYMNYPGSERYRLTGNESNPRPNGTRVPVSPDAEYTIAVDPGHEHVNVMRQLLKREPQNGSYPKPWEPNNEGFVIDYAGRTGASGDHIMRCFDPEKIPVMATLAREFAVCTRWFCSVPGATWPNRNFAHAATSDGSVNNDFRYYFNTTIFERLDKAGGNWTIYRDGSFQALCFWYVFRNSWKVKRMSSFYRNVAANTLPKYSFIEPYHLRPKCNSQHPYYSTGENSFLLGEKLIADVYNALKANREVFDKTLLLITYDEHGGFFDREAPPKATPPGDGSSPQDPHFDFSMLGPRVPALLISPRIPRGTIDTDTTYDHASIVSTARALFAPRQEPLTNRDRDANTLHGLANGPVRTQLPEVRPLPLETAPGPVTYSETSLGEYHSFEETLIETTLMAGRALDLIDAGLSMTQVTEQSLDAPSYREQFSSDKELFDRLDQVLARIVSDR